jgi:hypothetical protein
MKSNQDQPTIREMFEQMRDENGNPATTEWLAIKHKKTKETVVRWIKDNNVPSEGDRLLFDEIYKRTIGKL